jgi:hypothetical protein
MTSLFLQGFLAPIDCLKIPALIVHLPFLTYSFFLPMYQAGRRLPFVADGRGWGGEVAKSDERAMRVRGRFLNLFRAFPVISLYIKNNLIFKKMN